MNGQFYMEDLLGSYRLRFLNSKENVISHMRQAGLDYGFVRDLMDAEPIV